MRRLPTRRSPSLPGREPTGAMSHPISMSSPPVPSASDQTRPACSRPWPRATIVAEALVAVAEPLVTVLRPGPLAPPDQVAAALARSLAPAEADDPVPAWLWPEQRTSFRRTVAALPRVGGGDAAGPG